MATVGDLQQLNEATRETALRLLEPLVERAAWVAESAVDGRPFASDQDVAQHLVNTILQAGFEQRLALFRGHPELAGAEAAEGTMTRASTSEQGRLGLMSLAPETAERLSRMNALYRERFGYPFILALHRVSDLDTVFGVFEQRLAASPVEEHVASLAEIASVVSARCAQAFGGSSKGSLGVQPVEAADG